MEITIERIDKEQWKSLSESAHKICFREERDPETERIDFALLAVMVFPEGSVPLGYITVRELHRDHIYWQFGGTFPSAEKTVLAYRGYERARDWCKVRYKTIDTYIEPSNIPMLKMAFKLGFRIIGVKHVFNKTYVELFLNLED